MHVPAPMHRHTRRGPSQKGPDSSDAAPNVRGLSQIAQMAKVSSRLLKGLGVGARVVDASAADAMVRVWAAVGMRGESAQRSSQVRLLAVHAMR